jgi:two-component system, NtrC family, sensor kinase
MKAPPDPRGEQPSVESNGAPAPATRTSIVRSRLFLKYVGLLIAVVTLALIANGVFDVWFSFQEQKASLLRLQREQAEAAAGKIGQFISEIERQVGWTTQLPWSASTLDQRRFDALRLLRQVPAITELAEIDSTGHEQLRVSRLAMDVVGSGVDVSKEQAFTEAVAHKTYYGPVYFRRESEPYMTLSLAGTRRDAGVSIAQVNLKLIEDVLSQIKFTGHGRAYVVDAQGRLIAHPDISLVLRNTDMSQLAQVRAARAAAGNASAEHVQEATDIAGQPVLSAYAPISPLNWLLFVEAPAAEAYAPLYASIERTGYVLLGALALAFIAGLFLAGRMVVPIQALRAGAARLGGGDLSQRIAIRTGDEVEALADQFNDMAGRLQESYANLEHKVEVRTRELSESLEQQTATSEVLGVISSSPGELKPVFDTMLKNALRICDAAFGALMLFENGLWQTAAVTEADKDTNWGRWLLAEPRSFGPETALGRIARSTQVLHIPDLRHDISDTRTSATRAAFLETGARTFLGAPLLRGDELVGAIVLYRREVSPFADKQIELLKNFAAQAVIAIENTRLLKELRETLEGQTATSDILRVIAASPGDAEGSLRKIAETTARLFSAAGVSFRIAEGGTFKLSVGVGHGAEQIGSQLYANPATRPTVGGHNLPGTVVRENRQIHLPDLDHLDDEFADWPGPPVARRAGIRTMVGTPLRAKGSAIGALIVYRNALRPFIPAELELLQSFADQAVIAIENARLFEAEQQRTRELTESLEQQTATADVLRVISSSPGDLGPVFSAMLENAIRICGAKFGTIYRREGESLHLEASHNTPPALAEARKRDPHRAGKDNRLIGRMLTTKAAVQIEDAAATEGYLNRTDTAAVAAVDLGGARTCLAVPLLKDDEVVGSFTLMRDEVRPFTDKQIELVANFASQAVIAIENARLLTELRTRTAELGRSVGELRALGEVSQAVNSTLNLENVLETIVSKAVQLSNTDAGAIYVFDDAQRDFDLRATYGMDAGMIAALRHARINADDRNVATMLAAREPIQNADLSQGDITDVDRIIVSAGYRSRLTAPLIRGDDIVGMLVVRRRAPGLFPQNTVDLIKTFAAQSAVAIQNARLYANVETRTRELAKSLQDLHTAQDRLVQTEKLASLGQLTAGIAHEIKNPLNFVNNFSSISVELIDELQETLDSVAVDDKTRGQITELADMLRGNLDKVVQHGKRADSIVKNMLLHSRQGSGEHQSVEINALVEESLNLAYHGARAEKQGFNITLERSFDPTAGKVDLFPQEITRVLLNLISNGFYAATKRKAQTDGGNYEPKLGATTKNLGESIEIRIRDNGTGIPPDVKEKMFNPFFTTKPAGEGTGLGLSLSHDIVVKQHAGSIEVDTRPGEFTEFRIVLPRSAAAIAKAGGSA